MLLPPFVLPGTILIWRWVLRLRGPGLVLLGIADNSAVPLTGSMDVITIWLAASDRRLWPYYALMATIGAVLGGYFTYALARKGGKQAIEHKLSPDRAEKILLRFQKWGFRAVLLAAILPPPFPIVPVLLAAGVAQYPRNKFLAALALGRAGRYTLVAGLGALYGGAILAFFSTYYKPAALILAALAGIGAAFTLVKYLRSRHKDARAAASKPQHKAA
jgi:membrane protein YqaA with SNARE-associated domain